MVLALSVNVPQGAKASRMLGNSMNLWSNIVYLPIEDKTWDNCNSEERELNYGDLPIQTDTGIDLNWFRQTPQVSVMVLLWSDILFMLSIFDCVKNRALPLKKFCHWYMDCTRHEMDKQRPSDISAFTQNL